MPHGRSLRSRAAWGDELENDFSWRPGIAAVSVSARGRCHGRIISGYGRLRLRGSLRHLYQPSFMFRYLCSAGVRLKDFAGFVSGLTNRVCAASAAFAERCGRPLRYLESCFERKDDLARRLAQRDRI